jgi:hypothetical protein
VRPSLRKAFLIPDLFSLLSGPRLFYARTMKNLFAIFLFLTCIESLAFGQIGSIMDPYPIGTAAATIITFGDAYSTAIETYDARITLIEVVRGKNALDLLRKQNTSYPMPDPAFEYALARIRFEFAAKGKPGDKTYEVRDDQFIAFSSDGATQYPAVNAAPPKPRLAGTLRSGDSAEGWVLFLVARADQKPFTAFRADVRLISHAGLGPAFRLY